MTTKQYHTINSVRLSQPQSVEMTDGKPPFPRHADAVVDGGSGDLLIGLHASNCFPVMPSGSVVSFSTAVAIRVETVERCLLTVCWYVSTDW